MLVRVDDDPSALFHVEHGAKVLRCGFQLLTQIRENFGMGSGGQLGRHVDRLVVFGDKHDTLLVEWLRKCVEMFVTSCYQIGVSAFALALRPVI